jgi:hypothetical protein
VQALLSGTDNTTIEEVIQHLTAMGVMDLEVREAHHYALGWLSLRRDSGTGNTVCFRLWVCTGTGMGLDFCTRGKTVPVLTVLWV